MPKIKQPQDSTRWERINKIYEILDTSTATITELANMLDVSTKTIQRDIYDVLISYGAVREGRKWRIDKSKVATENLDANDRIVLAILDEMAKNCGVGFYSKARTLLAKVTQQLEHPVFANIDSEALSSEDMEMFAKMENAISSQKEITFTYKEKPFRVKPLKLAFFESFWYLLVFDVKSGDMFKKFHLKSISNLKTTTKGFELKIDIQEKLKRANSIWFQIDKEPIAVNLFIDKTVAKYFKRKPLKTQSIVGEDADGSIEIAVSITSEMEITPTIFWFLPHIKVLSPKWLADSVKKKVAGYLEETN